MSNTEFAVANAALIAAALKGPVHRALASVGLATEPLAVARDARTVAFLRALELDQGPTAVDAQREHADVDAELVDGLEIALELLDLCRAADLPHATERLEVLARPRLRILLEPAAYLVLRQIGGGGRGWFRRRCRGRAGDLDRRFWRGCGRALHLDPRRWGSFGRSVACLGRLPGGGDRPC